MRAMGQNPTEDEVFFHDRGHDDDGDHSDHGDDYDDLIGVFSSWAIQTYKLVTQEYKNSILDIIDRPQWWKTTINEFMSQPIMW